MNYMRISFGISFSLAAGLMGLGAPQPPEPAPLLKPVVPPGSSIRVRIPVIEERGTTMQFKAQIPKGPKGMGMKGETIDVTVAIDTLPGPSYVSTKLWQSWGYEIPANKTARLSELIITASQIAPKISKGRDVQVKLPSMAMEIVDPPGGTEKVRGCDIFLSVRELTKNADRTYETRFYFQDKYFELTVPSGSIKRLGTGEENPPDPAITDDPELVTVVGPTVVRGLPLMAYSSINGLTQYKTADGKTEFVSTGISSTNDWPTGVLLTMGTARGCNVELDQEKDDKGVGATFETRVIKGKIKELRLGVMTGLGLKTQKDIVIKDLEVVVDKSSSGHFVWLGPRFLDTYLKDHIYACGTDGMWQLHGRIKPDLLQDIKNRPKKP
jgi:hypothetical protein